MPRYIFPIFWAFTGSLCLAQTNDLPPLDTNRLLQELTTLVDKQESLQKSVTQRQIGTLQLAATSSSAAAKLYEDAVRNNLEKSGKSEPFSEWRRAHADELRSASFQAAAQMHARYLQMGLEYDPKEPETLAETSWEYAQALARVLADPKLAPSTDRARDLLQEPANKSEISRWLEVGSSWPPDKFWAPQAGNLEDILNKNVRPVWRDNKDLRLLSTWDLQIRLGEDRAKNNEQAAQDFSRNEKPRLLFQRARDLAVIGQPNRAITDILSIAQSNPSHPEFPAWVHSLKSMLKPESLEPASQTLPH